MRTEQKPDSTAYNCLASFVECPRESCTRSEVEVVRIIRLIWIAKTAEVHFPQIGRRFEIDNLRRRARGRIDFHDEVIIVTKAKVHNEALVHAILTLCAP